MTAASDRQLAADSELEEGAKVSRDTNLLVAWHQTLLGILSLQTEVGQLIWICTFLSHYSSHSSSSYLAHFHRQLLIPVPYTDLELLSFLVF